jgi:hypothetical protein
VREEQAQVNALGGLSRSLDSTAAPPAAAMNVSLLPLLVIMELLSPHRRHSLDHEDFSVLFPEKSS